MHSKCLLTVEFPNCSWTIRRCSPLLAVFSLLVLAAFFSAAAADSQIYLVSTFAGRPGGRGKIDGPHEIARLYYPGAITADVSGNIYFLDLTTLRKIDQDGTVRVIAGQWGLSGTNDGPAALSTVGGTDGALFVQQIAADTNGNIFIADQRFHTVRKVDPSGVLTTYAGRPGVSGSADGTAAAATFNGPFGLCLDGSGTIFVSDAGAIRKISRDGLVSTISFSGPDIDAFDHSQPEYLAAASDGNIRVTFAGNSSAAGKMTPGGVLSWIPVTNGYIDRAQGLAVLPDGSMVIPAQTDFIQVLHPNGQIESLAGKRNFTGSSDGKGDSARFHGIAGIAADPGGNVLVSDAENYCIRKIDSDGNVTTIAGLPGGSEDGHRLAARFSSPAGIAFGPDGSLYVADTLNHTIRKIAPNGLVSTVAGTPNERRDASTLTNSSPLLDHPMDVAVDAATNVYVSEGEVVFDLVRKYSSGATFETLPFLQSRRSPGMYLAVAADGTVYRSSSFYSPIGQIPRVRPGAALDEAGRSFMGYADGSFATARFNFPSGMTADSSGNIYVADLGNVVIRKIDTNDVVSTVAGIPNHRGYLDGPAAEAEFFGPTDVAFAPNGELYVFDNGERIRKISTNGIVSTLKLTASFGPPMFTFLPDGTLFSTYDVSGGIAVDQAGRVFIADTADNTVKVCVPLASPSPVDLRISRISETMTLSWRADSSQVQLQTSTNVHDRFSWSPVAATGIGGEANVAIPNAAGAARFYRLHVP